MYVEARGQLSGTLSLLPPIRPSGLLAMSLTTEPAHWLWDLQPMKKQGLPGVTGGKQLMANQVTRCAPVVPATWETENTGFLEPLSLRIAWVTSQGSVSNEPTNK